MIKEIWMALPFKKTNGGIISWVFLTNAGMIDFLDPEFARLISYYCAAFLSVSTGFIAWYKFIKENKNTDQKRSTN
jgi:hypothetical protein